MTWLRRWGISIGSLAMGLATLFVFRRGLPHVGWIVGYTLLLGLVVAVLAEARVPLEARGRGRVVSAAEYTIQTLYHNLLLFVLPAYWASATPTSPNVIFVAGVALGALITAIDPLYAALGRQYRWLKHALLAFSLFAALNVALPLVGVRPGVRCSEAPRWPAGTGAGLSRHRNGLAARARPRDHRRLHRHQPRVGRPRARAARPSLSCRQAGRARRPRAGAGGTRSTARFPQPTVVEWAGPSPPTPRCTRPRACVTRSSTCGGRTAG
jgi:hypothetical protein